MQVCNTAPLRSRLTVGALALALSMALSAQTANDSNGSSDDASTTKPTVKAQEVKTTKQQPQTIKAQSAKNADSYEASEEISEDLSVSYPVDI